jgi:DNA polymerase I
MKLLIVDGNAVLHRAYYAMPDWRNRSGEATAGVYGFLSMLLRAKEELKPTHLVVTFDNPEPTFRHIMYVGYQTNREKERQVSEDIWGQVEKLKIVFEKMGVPVFCVAGFEADDVIGTIAKQCTKMKNSSALRGTSSLIKEEEGYRKDIEVIIITGDKDLMQLVDDKVKLFMPQKGLSDGVIVDENKVMEKLGVYPNQVIDYKALVGDSSDNYPGVPGIGPKTAVHLLAEYGDFEKIYASLKVSKTSPLTPLLNLGEGIIKKLAEGYESGELSKRLATIRMDAPVTLQLNKAMVPSDEKIVGVLNELGYKSLIRRAQKLGTKDDKLQPGLF